MKQQNKVYGGGAAKNSDKKGPDGQNQQTSSGMTGFNLALGKVGNPVS